MDSEDVESEEQVLPKPTLFDHLAKVSIGRRDNPNIHFTSFLPPNAKDLSLLENAEEFHLKIQLGFTDFVEE
jgi:hypothetical protein